MFRIPDVFLQDLYGPSVPHDANNFGAQGENTPKTKQISNQDEQYQNVNKNIASDSHQHGRNSCIAASKHHKFSLLTTKLMTERHLLCPSEFLQMLGKFLRQVNPTQTTRIA